MRGRVLVGVAVLVAIAAGAWVLLRDDGFDGDTRGARIERFDVTSRLAGETLQQTLIRPAGGSDGRPLLVFLHGRNSSPDTMLSAELFDALEALGDRAPAILFVNGGKSSYYHDRRDGRWGSYVMREALPAGLRRSGADPRRVAIGGISMGGFGALDLARLHPTRFCAVGGHSAALWQGAGETPEGAFDDADDFARHDVIGAARGRTRPLGDVPVRMDVGTGDPFLAADRAMAQALRADRTRVALHEAEGGHEHDYWLRHLDEYLRFYAGALARCGRR
jgi:S-formylglutathione hydrolase FrmB